MGHALERRSLKLHIFMHYSQIKSLKAVFIIILAVIIITIVGSGRITDFAFAGISPSVLAVKIIGTEFGYGIYYFDYMLGSVGEAQSATSATGTLAGDASSIPVLTYHGILRPTNSPDIVIDGVNIPMNVFKDQMFALKRAGYRTVSMDDLYLFLRGEKKLPAGSFVLTFDDGRRDSFYPADPLLHALGFKATMFVVSNYSFERKTDFYLSPPELLYMVKSGRWNMESHGKDDHEFYPLNDAGLNGHFLTNLLWLPDQNRLESIEEYSARISGDLSLSKETISASLGVPVIAFAFPFGDFGEGETNYFGIKNILLANVENNYQMAFYQHGLAQRFTQNYASSDLSKNFFMVRRIEPDVSWTGAKLLSVLETGNSKFLPYVDDLDTDKGWINTWNYLSLADGALTLKATESSSGGSAILDGTYAWKDYYLEAHVNNQKGNNIYVWVRYQDDNNYAACNFSPNLVHVEKLVDGVQSVAKGVQRSVFSQGGDFVVGVRAAGRSIQCVFNGEVMVETEFLDSKLDRGGIGFKTWHPQDNVAELVIKNINVQPINK